MLEAYSRHALPPDSLIQEYRVIGVLGMGGFGIVYSAEHTVFDEIVAIKEFLPTKLSCRKEGGIVAPLSSETEEVYHYALQNFLKEAKILRQLGRPQPHPAIVRVRQYIEANETAYMVLDFEKGSSLSEILKAKGTLPEAEIKAILASLFEGLERVHNASVWHRDIKPGNLILRSDGSPVLIDFGAARQEIAGSDQSVMASFSPAYAAPEQVYGSGEQGPWTDIFSLGATLYQAVTGQKPTNAAERMQGKTCIPAIQVAEGEYSRRFLSAIDAALALNIKDRPQTISAWKQLFESDSPQATREQQVGKVANSNTLLAKGEPQNQSNSFGHQSPGSLSPIGRIEKQFPDKKNISPAPYSKWAMILTAGVLLLLLIFWIGPFREREQGEIHSKIPKEEGDEVRTISQRTASQPSESLGSPAIGCEAHTDPTQPLGFVCAYFRDCRNRDAAAAIAKRSDLSPDLKAFLRREIQNCEKYEIIDLSLMEQTKDHAEVYVEYSYQRRSQATMSYVGSIILGRKPAGQWEIASMTQTVD